MESIHAHWLDDFLGANWRQFLVFLISHGGTEDDANTISDQLQKTFQSRPRQCVSSSDAVTGKTQHTKPCTDCPMARTALPGWLGGATSDEYVQLAHSDAVVACHSIKSTQCAGMAIYRRNVVKRCDPPNLVLPADRNAVFATPSEFINHHTGNKRLHMFASSSKPLKAKRK